MIERTLGKNDGNRVINNKTNLSITIYLIILNKKLKIFRSYIMLIFSMLLFCLILLLSCKDFSHWNYSYLLKFLCRILSKGPSNLLNEFLSKVTTLTSVYKI